MLRASDPSCKFVCTSGVGRAGNSCSLTSMVAIVANGNTAARIGPFCIIPESMLSCARHSGCAYHMCVMTCDPGVGMVVGTPSSKDTNATAKAKAGASVRFARMGWAGECGRRWVAGVVGALGVCGGAALTLVTLAVKLSLINYTRSSRLVCRKTRRLDIGPLVLSGGISETAATSSTGPGRSGLCGFGVGVFNRCGRYGMSGAFASNLRDNGRRIVTRGG